MEADERSWTAVTVQAITLTLKRCQLAYCLTQKQAEIVISVCRQYYYAY